MHKNPPVEPGCCLGPAKPAQNKREKKGENTAATGLVTTLSHSKRGGGKERNLRAEQSLVPHAEAGVPTVAASLYYPTKK